jgi:acyl dehydratase
MWWHPGSKCFDEFKVGDRFVSPGKTISEYDIEAFARLSGDYNPLHTDETAAKQGEYGRRICPHLLPMTILTGLFMGRLGIFDTTGLAFLALENLRFLEPVYIGDTIRAELQVESMRVSQSKPDFGVAVFRIEGLKEKGEHFLECEWHEWIARESWKEKHRNEFSNI